MAENYFSKAPKFNPATFTQGANLGMWSSLGAGSTTSNQASGFNDNLAKAISTLKREGLDPNEFKDVLGINMLLGNNSQNSLEDQKEAIRFARDLDYETALKRQELAEKSLGKGLLYQSLANIGPTIAQAMNPNYGYAVENAARIANAGSEAFRSVPSMNIQAPGYNFSQFKYF